MKLIATKINESKIVCIDGRGNVSTASNIDEVEIIFLNYFSNSGLHNFMNKLVSNKFNIDITWKYLLKCYENAIKNKEFSTLSEEEMAGYWLYMHPRDTMHYFNVMLQNNDILLSENSYYNKVCYLLKEVVF